MLKLVGRHCLYSKYLPNRRIIHCNVTLFRALVYNVKRTLGLHTSWCRDVGRLRPSHWPLQYPHQLVVQYAFTFIGDTLQFFDRYTSIRMLGILPPLPQSPLSRYLACVLALLNTHSIQGIRQPNGPTLGLTIHRDNSTRDFSMATSCCISFVEGVPFEITTPFAQ